MTDDKKEPVAILKFTVDFDHLPETAEIMTLMEAAKKIGTPRDAKLSIPRQILSNIVT